MTTKSWKVLGLIAATILVFGGALLMAFPENSRVASGQSLKLPLVNPKIVVLKGKRQLLLYADGELVRTYSIGLGLVRSMTR